jgi:hypothetical protein
MVHSLSDTQFVEQLSIYPSFGLFWGELLWRDRPKADQPVFLREARFRSFSSIQTCPFGAWKPLLGCNS